MSEDLELTNAFRAAREELDGQSPDADLTLQRALFATRRNVRRRQVTQWILVPIAAALVASTAWAGMSGRLAPVMRSLDEALHTSNSDPQRADPNAPHAGPAVNAPRPSDDNARDAAAPSGEPASEPRAETAASAADAVARDTNSAVPSSTPAAVPAPEHAGDPSSISHGASTSSARGTSDRTRTARASEAAAPRDAVAPVGSPSAPAIGSGSSAPPKPNASSAGVDTRSGLATTTSRPTTAATSSGASSPASAPAAPATREAQLFAEANRIHFVERDPARALAAWDRYLAAAPTGALAPEARYNRALALIRLGRTAEARAELERFATGTYRRAEARALLDALARDAGAP